MLHELKSGERVIIYGMGFAGKILANWIEFFTEAEVAAFVVSDGWRDFSEYSFPHKMKNKTIPVYEYSELPESLDDCYVINSVAVMQRDEVKNKLESDDRIKNRLIEIGPDGWHRQMLVCRKFCDEYGIDVSNELVECKGMRFYIRPDDDMFMINFYGTFADTFVPQLFDEYALTNDGPYEIDDYGVTIKPGDYVIDAGANDGLYSCYAAHMGCNVYACDCDRASLEILSKQRSLYPDKIDIIPYALSDHVGTATFYESNNSGLSSLCIPRGSVTEKKVELETLDHLVETGKIRHIDFIKADIEGAERDLLRGSTRVLKEMAPKLSICTYHYPEDPKLLESIIKDANPAYVVRHAWRKLYAHV